jgi:prepilin peptidase CpaA
MNEFHSLLELLGMLITDPRTGVLIILLATAAWHDYRTFKIPNWLCGGGTVFALIYNAIVPPYFHAAWWWAPAGMMVGFGATLPLYLLRAMGAGDVKLMATVGAFLGASGAANSFLYSAIIAGIAALAFAASNGLLIRMLKNVRSTLQSMAWSAIGGVRPSAHLDAAESVGKLAYGISIAIGTTIYVVAQQLGFA